MLMMVVVVMLLLRLFLVLECFRVEISVDAFANLVQLCLLLDGKLSILRVLFVFQSFSLDVFHPVEVDYSGGGLLVRSHTGLISGVTLSLDFVVLLGFLLLLVGLLFLLQLVILLLYLSILKLLVLGFLKLLVFSLLELLGLLLELFLLLGLGLLLLLLLLLLLRFLLKISVILVLSFLLGGLLLGWLGVLKRDLAGIVLEDGVRQFHVAVFLLLLPGVELEGLVD